MEQTLVIFTFTNPKFLLWSQKNLVENGYQVSDKIVAEVERAVNFGV